MGLFIVIRRENTFHLWSDMSKIQKCNQPIAGNLINIRYSVGMLVSGPYLGYFKQKEAIKIIHVVKTFYEIYCTFSLNILFYI